MEVCYFCKGKVEKQKINHMMHWKDRFVLFENLEAEVCKQCGEVYFSPENLEWMDRHAQSDAFQKKIEVPVVSVP